MRDRFVSNKDKNLEEKAAYYIKVVEPMMRNDGKLIKEVLSNYAKQNNIATDKAQTAKTIENLYKTQKNHIDSILERKPELKAKIQELKNDPNKLDVASGGKKLVSDEPEVKLGENKQKAYSRKDEYKDQLYREKNMDSNDLWISKKGR